MKGDRRAVEIASCQLLLVFRILSWSSAAGKRPRRSARKRSTAARRRRQQAPSLLDRWRRRRRRLLRRRGRRWLGATGGAAVYGVGGAVYMGSTPSCVRLPHRRHGLRRACASCIAMRTARGKRGEAREREREVPRGRLPPQLQRARAAAAVRLLRKRASQRSKQIMRGRRWLSAAGHTKVENR